MDMSFQESVGESLLRLLRAEIEAGHTNHGNEIQNIIEELMEAGYIYM